MADSTKQQNAQNYALDQATKRLIKQLPDHVYELLEEFASEHARPLWQTTLGVILNSYTLGLLSQIQYDPAWVDGVRQDKSTCKQCGAEFKPINLGQPYCSNECGLRAAGEWHDDSGVPDRSIDADGGNNTRGASAHVADPISDWVDPDFVPPKDAESESTDEAVAEQEPVVTQRTKPNESILESYVD